MPGNPMLFSYRCDVVVNHRPYHAPLGSYSCPEVGFGDPNPVSREFAREWHFNGLTYQPSGPVGVAPSIAGARRRNPGLMSRQGQAEVRRPVNAVISA